MTPREFYDLVRDMRQQQKRYFATRDRDALTKSKELEKLIDGEIERVENILNGRGVQTEINFEQ